MKGKFTQIDMKSWKRTQIFHYFTQMVPTTFSITIDVDITLLKRYIDNMSLKLFPVYVWLVTRNLMKQQELSIGKVDGNIGYWDTLTPLYPTFHDDDKTISLMWTEFSDDFHTFYDEYMKNKAQNKDNKGILSVPGAMPPPNAYPISVIPWMNFKHFSLNTSNDNFFMPNIEGGQYIKKDGKLIMPLAITVHHAATDAWHVSEFIKDLQNDMDNFNRIITG